MTALSEKRQCRWYELGFGRRFWRAAGIVLILAVAAYGAVRWQVEQSLAADAADHPAGWPGIQPAERNRLRAAAKRILPLQIKKRAPEENDWLARHGTEGQSFAAYWASNPNRPNRNHATLYVLPIGEMTPAQLKIIEKTRELLGIFYGVPAKSLSGVPLASIPDEVNRRRTEDKADDQILTSYLLEDVLAPRRPLDAVAVLGLTARDLYPGDDWNYVFGQATFEARVGIHSFHRYGNPDASDEEYQLCLLRTLKVAIHETGHMFGLPHCRVYECGMNGSNHKEELDKNVLGFCVDCEQKLWWSCRLPIRQRYEKLLRFAEENKLGDQAMIWRAHLAKFDP